MAIHRGDIGLVVEVQFTCNGVPDTIPADALLEMRFFKPNGQSMSRPAVLSTDGTDGKIRYTMVDGDLDYAGRWMYQGFVTLVGGDRWASDIQNFTVEETLPVCT